jgi:hypothetical protein
MMKTLSMIAAAIALAATFAVPVWAGPVDMERTAPEAQASPVQAQVNPGLLARLQEASEQAIRDGRNGNKNNPAFGQKSAQINDLIERLKSGQNVDPSEIDQALQPVYVW